MAQSTCWAILALAPNDRFAPGSDLGSLFQNCIGCITFIKQKKKPHGTRLSIFCRQEKFIKETQGVASKGETVVMSCCS